MSTFLTPNEKRLKLTLMDFVKQKPIFVFLALALVAAGFLVWQDFRPEPDEGGSVKNTNEAPKEIEVGNGISIEAEGDVSGMVVEKIELKIPDLSRPIKISGSLNITEKNRQEYVLQIQEISSTLKGNYDYLQGWLQLGILRKQIGDYEGAIEAWDFAGVLRPNNATSFLNLADLYAFYIKDRIKAEGSFLKAVSADPQNGFAYFQFAGFYRDILQNVAKAKEILRQGISAGVDTTGDLQLLLNSL